MNSSGKVGIEAPILRVRTCVAWNNIGVLHFKNINSKTVVSCEVYNVNSIGKVGIWHWNTSCQGSYLHCLDSRNVKMPECHNENIYWRWSLHQIFRWTNHIILKKLINKFKLLPNVSVALRTNLVPLTPSTISSFSRWNRIGLMKTFLRPNC